MRRPTLYVCPATQGAVIAAAPAIADDRDFRIAKVLILRGVADASRPTRFEEREALRPAEFIGKFFTENGIPVEMIDGPPDDAVAWRQLLSARVTADFLEGVEAVLVNAQAGTKQMSFGAWDALQAITGARRSNLGLGRCFVANGAICMDDGRCFPVPPLPVERYLRLYGFEEIEAEKSRAKADWLARNRELVRRVALARLRDDAAAAYRAADDLFRNGPAPWPREAFGDDGYWLEGLVYIKALEWRDRTRGAARDVRTSVKVRDRRGQERFGPHGNLLNDYEIDLAVTGPGTIHLAECKSGEIERANLDLLKVLRARLQGRAGVSALIGRHKVKGPKSALGQKAKAAAIRWVQATASCDELDSVFGEIFS